MYKVQVGKRSTNSNLEAKIGNDAIPQVTIFKYIDFIIQNNGEIEGDINHRIQTMWLKWRIVSILLYNYKTGNSV